VRFNRRQFLASAAAGSAALAWSTGARAQSKKLEVLLHRSHQQVMENGPSGDIVAPWGAANGTEIQFLTFDTGPLNERLLREASLNATDIDVAFFLDDWASPNAFNLLEPLNGWLERDPIEAFDDFFAGPVAAVSHEGQLFGIPIRQNVAGLHYNEDLLNERGLSGPPATIEEFLDYARQLTYVREDGTPVVGFVLANQASNFTHFVRAWNADFITSDLRVTAAEAPMVAAITALRDLYAAGAFPRNFPSVMQEEASIMMQGGRAAMTITNMSRSPQLNNPANTEFAGRIKAVNVPSSESIAGEFEIAPVGVSFWSMVIPRNARDKELSWSFIRDMSTRASVRALALNGNGPMRSSLYDDPEYQAMVPYAAAEQRALSVARQVMPSFANGARANDAIQEEVEAAVLGFKEVQQAMDDLSNRIEALL
jgi:multiple sugar transport system substrate-binding protein